MKSRTVFAALAASLLSVTGCDTTDSGSSHTTVYYGTGSYSPWYYYGDCCDDHHHHGGGDNIIINPPPGGGGDWGSPRPSHPIANAPGRGDGFGGGRPSVSPRPSIPSTPRPSMRGGGGGRGGRGR